MATKFFRNSKATIGKIRDDLYNAFEWSSSAEGSEYWTEVVKKLDRYYAEAGKADECKEVIEEIKQRLAELEARYL